MIKSNASPPKKEDNESKILIEDWTKCNSTSSLIITQDNIKKENTNEEIKDPLNFENCPTDGNKTSILPKKEIKIEKNVQSVEIISKNSNIISSIKRPHEEEGSNIEKKIPRQSLPIEKSKLPSICRPTEDLVQKSKSDSNIKQIIKITPASVIDQRSPRVSNRIKAVKSNIINSKVSDNEKSNPNSKAKTYVRKIPSSLHRIVPLQSFTNNLKLQNKKCNINLQAKTINEKIPSISCSIESAKSPTINSKVINKRYVPILPKPKTINQKISSTSSSIEPANNFINSLKASNKTCNPDLKTKITIKKIPNVLCCAERTKSPASNVNISDRKCDLDLKGNAIVPKIPSFSCSTEIIKIVANNVKEVEQKRLSTPVQLNPKRLTSPMRKGINNSVDNLNTDSVKQILSKEKDTNVYIDLLESYRYLITPKSWTVMEMLSDTRERCVVFFNANIIKENDVFMSVMKKCLVINKEAKMNYSVHGLPVNINGSILPKVLDNTQKLLSILHIFDKMQICEGLGNDLNINQDDTIYKDSFRYFRHKDCKIILVKATRCPACTLTRKVLLKTETS